MTTLSSDHIACSCRPLNGRGSAPPLPLWQQYRKCNQINCDMKVDKSFWSCEEVLLLFTGTKFLHTVLSPQAVEMLLCCTDACPRPASSTRISAEKKYIKPAACTCTKSRARRPAFEGQPPTTVTCHGRSYSPPTMRQTEAERYSAPRTTIHTYSSQ